MSSDVGKITWQDLTIPNAERVRDFYAKVVGWRWEAAEMGGYSDFSMIPPGGKDAVSGICHARGPNADIPPQWLIYITVESLDQSIAECNANGGVVITAPRPAGGGTMCVVRDPAGAVCRAVSTVKRETPLG